MSINKLNKTYDSKVNILKIKNILDFSFGEENKANKKEDDVEMFDMAPKKTAIKENTIKKINGEENGDISKITNDKFNLYKINNDNIIDFPENRNYLISKKRKRKNECSSKSIGISKLKKHFPNKNHQHSRNKSIKTLNIYDKIMGVNEDSIDNDNNEDNKNEIDAQLDSKDISFNNVYDFVLKKFNKINLDKKG